MNWRSIRIGDFLHRIRIPVDIEDDQDYNLVTIRMHHKGVALRGTKRGKDIGTKRMYRVAPGHFILSGIDARHGAFGIVPEELDGAVVTNDFWYFEVDEKQVDKELFLHLTSTSFFDDLCRIASDGTTNRVRLQADKFFNYEINLPAIEDQRELMAQLKHTNHAVATVLHETDQQLAHLAQLRQALLREAMQGQLLPQDPTDEPAALLLKKLQAAKAATGKGGKAKSGTLFAEEAEVEGPFEIPASWAWCTLGDLVIASDAGTSFQCENRPIIGNEWGVIKLSAISWDKFLPEQNKFYSAEAPEELAAQIRTGDFIISRANTTELVGKSVVVQEGNYNLLLSDKSIRFTFSPLVSVAYANLCNNSQYARAHYANAANGSSPSMKNITQANMRNLPIPLPPLAEQHRIVEKLAQLFRYCDALEQRIRESRRLAERLLQTALREALAPPASVAAGV